MKSYRLKCMTVSVAIVIIIWIIYVFNILKYAESTVITQILTHSSNRTNRGQEPSFIEETPKSTVTRIIHQSWKTANIPTRFKQYSQSWTEGCFKNWKYMFWTDDDNQNLIATYYPWFLKRYLALPRSIYRADVSRYFYLHHHGGIYTDLDNECLKPFEHLLDGYSLVFGAMKGQYEGTSLKEGYVQNSFMYSQPGHPFWIEIILDILNNIGTALPEAQTGPVLLSNFIGQYRKRVNETGLKIYTPEYFNPFSWMAKNESSGHCKDFGEMSDSDWDICKKFFASKGSYVVQYHAHSWGEKGKPFII